MQRKIGCEHYYNDARKCVWCGSPEVTNVSKRDQFTVDEADRFIKLLNDTSMATMIGALANLCESKGAEARKNGETLKANHWGDLSTELTRAESFAQRNKF